MENILAKICENKLIEVNNNKKIQPLESLVKKVKYLSPTKGFAKNLKRKIEKKENAIIAEIKRGSPSKGMINKNANIIEIAKAYEKAGATCVSVLTDEKYFFGSNDDLVKVRENINLPILRKDFILDIYQIYEARLMGADCVLLIMSALDIECAKELENIAFSLDLDVLIEIHDEADLEKSFNLKSPLIGVNNRNLKTFTIDLSNTIRLKKLIAKDKTIICESGIHTYQDVEHMNRYEIYGFLVGESLMKQENIEKGLKELLGK